MSELTPEQRKAMREARDAMLARARAKGSGKRLSYALQAAALFPLVGLLKLLPIDVASATGGWIGRALVTRLLDRPAHFETMRVAFPQASDAELGAMLVEMCDHLGRVLGEVVHLKDFAGPANPRLVIKGADAVAKARRPGQGVLFIGGHFGNWELIPVALREAGFDGVSVVQHPNNPYVVQWIAAERYRTGHREQVGAGEGVYAALRRALKAGGVAAMLADQRVLNGIKAPFFGVETTTNLIPARLARDLGAVVVPMSNRRIGGAHFEVVLGSPMEVRRTEDRAADERAVTAQINRFYEDQIRAAPASWLWGHPRFDDAFYELDARGTRLGRKAGASIPPGGMKPGGARTR